MLKNKLQCNSGFTLIEVAVVLVIVGLLVGSFIGTFTSRIDTSRRDATKNNLDEIKQVLMAYTFTQSPLFLPCPDMDVPPNGLGDSTAGVCDAAGAVGTLPWIDLGMGTEDAWGNRYSYWVDPAYSDRNIGFDISTPAAISAQVNTRINNNAAAMTANAVAVIFSRGKNGLGGISVEGVNRPAIPALGNGHDDEIENADANSVFMSRFNTDEGVTAAGGAFDDVLIWINDYELKAKMVEAGVLP